MSSIIAAKAYANNEVAFLAWNLAETIEGCLGFEITRIYVGTHHERPLAAWVSFKNQSNPEWKPQTTSVWPVQKLTWRDLTLRKRRDQTALRPSDVRVQYRIRPLARVRPGLLPVTIPPKHEYIGKPLPLAYVDEGMLTNEVLVTSQYGSLHAAFTNGILSAQWLRSALEAHGETLTPDSVRSHIQILGDPIRTYLTGDVLAMLKALLERADREDARVLLALYELSDAELLEMLLAHKERIEIILANTSKARGGTDWDVTNRQAREALSNAGVNLHNRMFNNNRIGHNKFAVLVGKDSQPQAVLTGSTNWTPTGLCGQSNNAIIIDSPDVARDYSSYWQQLLDDTQHFMLPAPLSSATANAQGPAIRKANAETTQTRTLADGTKVTSWFAPNTVAKTKKDVTPPDLAMIYALLRKAEQAIFFACFLPSRSGKLSIIQEAIDLGTKDPTLLVYGAISDPTAMPNYVPPSTTPDDEQADDDSEKKPQSAIFDKGRIHIVRAAALTKDDVVGEFESELLKVGNAIIHDKIVVIDPLSDHGMVVTGSHNLGYKASYENDENLLIIQGNRRLIEAYTVHILDVYDHYRFRAVQQDLHRQRKKSWDGFLSRDSKWLSSALHSDKGDLARYFSS